MESVARLQDGLWVTSGVDAAVDYPDTGHALLAEIEATSAWFRERNALIAEALGAEGLPATLIEVGAGNGFVAAHLRGLGVDAAAIEPAHDAARVSAARGVPTVCGRLEDLELPAASVEAVGLFDVLEHIPHPPGLLAEIHRVLAPGGRLAITVPAGPGLWSQADELAGHHRRYRRDSLIEELAAAGFAPAHVGHAFAALIGPVALARALPYRLGRRSAPAAASATGTRQVAGYGRAGRALARTAFALERRLRAVWDVPLGTSVVGVFRRC
jgi:SAM-dependent methyltransferase